MVVLLLLLLWYAYFVVGNIVDDEGNMFADFSLSVSDDVIEGVRLYGVHNIDDIASLTSVGRRLVRSILLDECYGA